MRDDGFIYTVGHLVWPLEIYGHNSANTECEPREEDEDETFSYGLLDLSWVFWLY